MPYHPFPYHPRKHVEWTTGQKPQPNVNKRDVLTRMLELEVDLEAFQLYEASLTDIFVSKAGDEE